MLNLNQPHRVLSEAYDFFDTGIAQMHSGYKRKGEFESWPQEHPQNRRVVYETTVKSREEAVAAAERFNAMRGRGW